jgi:hypothetical protein
MKKPDPKKPDPLVESGPIDNPIPSSNPVPSKGTIDLGAALDSEYRHGLYFGYCLGFLIAVILASWIRGE